MTDRQVANVRLQWLTAAEGGRQRPFLGSRYGATARFVGEEELFSVVLRFGSADEPNPAVGKLALLVPDRFDIQSRIRPGSVLEITEGPRTVAGCQVLSVAEVSLEPADSKGN